jgi:type I restriction enzyme S subunit
VILPGYLKHVIESNIGKSELYKRTLVKATPIKINLGEIGKIVIPVPCPDNPKKSLEIQTEIVRILDKFTELTAELTARKKQYTYYRDQLLTFEEGEVGWKSLGSLAENLDSMRKPVTSGLRESGDIPYYGASGIVDYVKDYIFDGDFLLISEDGANLGSVAK